MSNSDIGSLSLNGLHISSGDSSDDDDYTGDCTFADAQFHVAPILRESIRFPKLQKFAAWSRQMVGDSPLSCIGSGAAGTTFKHEPPTKPTSILKLVELPSPLDAKAASTVYDLVHEVKMGKLMSPVLGFVKLRDVHVVRGCLPPAFVHAVEQRNPDSTLSWKGSDQLWAIIEMEDCGRAAYILYRPSAFQCFDIFWGTCFALSEGERFAQFEHRDLHMGNICFSKALDADHFDIAAERNSTMSRAEAGRIRFGYSGLKATVIDLALSRATAKRRDAANAALVRPWHWNTCRRVEASSAVAMDRYQTFSYRSMLRNALHMHPTDISTPLGRHKLWAHYRPFSNVIWLRHLIKRLLHDNAGRIIDGSNDVSAELQRDLLRQMEGVLRAIDANIEQGAGSTSTMFPSASGLLKAALGRGWIQQNDLNAIRARYDQKEE